VSNYGATDSTLHYVHSTPGRIKSIVFPTGDDFSLPESFSMACTKFQEWWKSTPYGIRNLKFPWNATRRSKHWDYFKEVALFSTGEPKIRCKHCTRLLHHPSLQREGLQRQGTTSLVNHIRSKQCGLLNTDLQTQNQKNQLDIRYALSSEVCNILIL
jgi:hypothetical protein